MPVIKSAKVTEPVEQPRKIEIEARHPGIAAADDGSGRDLGQKACEVQEG
jgi:hypothetical protein